MRCEADTRPVTSRETFLDAIEAYARWSFGGGGTLPTVAREINYEPHQISLAEACGLVWNCTDILPGMVAETIETDLELPIRKRTYAAAARAMLSALKRQSA
jgi:hypothetical protein